VDFKFNSLPILGYIKKVQDKVINYKLFEGHCA